MDGALAGTAELDGLIAQAMAQPFTRVELPLPGRRLGKVREWFPLPGGRRLMVTTDRLSAFDRVVATVPFKGQVLNELSRWWFERTADIVGNHALAWPDSNAVVARECRRFPVEVVVRGCITGVTSTSLWTQYAAGQRKLYGYVLPEGLRKNQPLPEPLVTPTTKAASGHDSPLTLKEVVDHGLVPAGAWARIVEVSQALFRRGQELARRAGVVLADTKYEFGAAAGGEVVLIDELHTPDSSRFWDAATLEARLAAGEEPDNLDKEFVRRAYAGRGYRGEGEPPALPPELWMAAANRYVALLERLTGAPFDPGEYPVLPRLAGNLRAAGLVP